METHLERSQEEIPLVQSPQIKEEVTRLKLILRVDRLLLKYKRQRKAVAAITEFLKTQEFCQKEQTNTVLGSIRIGKKMNNQLRELISMRSSK